MGIFEEFDATSRPFFYVPTSNFLPLEFPGKNMAAIKFGALFVFVFCTMPFLYPGRPRFVVLGVLDFSDIFPSLQALLLQRNDMLGG